MQGASALEKTLQQQTEPHQPKLFASVTLNLPQRGYTPVAVQIGGAGPGAGTANYRAFVFVNGWLIGRYVNNMGPQHQFYVPAGILNGQGEFGEAVSERHQTDACFHPGQRIAETEVRAEPERLVLGGAVPGDVEAIGILEHGRVTICGCEHDSCGGALRNGHAADGAQRHPASRCA